MAAALPQLDIVSMILLGLFGTGHCLGMCGPLVIAFPARVGKLSAHLWYHLGRVGTYTLVGAILGGLGGALSRMGAVVHLQVILAALAAVFLLLLGLERIALLRAPKGLEIASPTKIPGYAAARRASDSGRPIGMLPLGLIMGFLPCGLSYAAFIRALPAGGAVEGGLLVLVFGAATMPGLLLLGTAASQVMRKHRALADILAGMLMIAMAVDLGADVLQAVF